MFGEFFLFVCVWQNAGIQLFIKLTWHYVQIQVHHGCDVVLARDANNPMERGETAGVAVTRFESSKITRVQFLNISSRKTFPTPLEK
jgi:hypothetical protein